MNNENFAIEIEEMKYMPTKIQYLYTDTDEKGHDIYAYKCGQPYCSNFYSAKDNSKAKSCGCLKIENARRMGLGQKKYNIVQQTPWDYIRVFFNNTNNRFFINNLKDRFCIVRARRKQPIWAQLKSPI